MTIHVLSSSAAHTRSWILQGRFEPHSAAHLADELRAQSLALGIVTRRELLERTRRLLELAERPALETVAGELERQGDLVAGPGGLIAPAPLRGIPVADDRSLIIGALPTATLLTGAPPAEVEHGLPRLLRMDGGTQSAWEAHVRGLGGRLVPVEQWSGLDRTPAADSAWLQLLTARLGSEGTAASTGLHSSWEEAQRYDAARWRPVRAGESTGLLRARQPGGWFAFGWGQWRGSDQVPAPFVPLTKDEARRTSFALDAETGGARLSCQRRGGGHRLLPQRPLPAAEYRMLLALAVRRETDTLPMALTFSTDDWMKVSALLENRLGVHLEEEVA